MLTQSCSKNNDDSIPVEDTYYYLTSAQLNQTPYFTNKAFDTISYTSDKGDTLTFVKTKTDTSWYGERANTNPEDQSMNYYQTINNTYSTIKGIGSFYVKHSKKGYFYGTQLDLIQINFNNIGFYFSDYQVGSMDYWTFKRNSLINNKLFNDLIVIYPNSYDSLSAEVYINKEYGLFYFNDKIKNIEFVKQN